MASVPLRFIAPDVEGLAVLHVLESAQKTGPFAPIEAVTAIGTYPDYIDRHTTTVAGSATDWFVIQWEDSSGGLSDLSQPVKGGSTTLVAKIIDRVLERDSSLDERVVSQEAEAAIQQALGTNVDPYDPALVNTVSYRVLSGLVYLTMARTYIVKATTTTAVGNVQSATLGLISFKSGSQSSTVQKNVQPLIDLANKELGIATSFVMLMDDISCPTYITYDHSRLVSGWVSIE